MNAIVYPVAIAAGSRFRAEGTIKRVAFTATDLAWRAGVVTLCVTSLERRDAERPNCVPTLRVGTRSYFFSSTTSSVGRASARWAGV